MPVETSSGARRRQHVEERGVGAVELHQHPGEGRLQGVLGPRVRHPGPRGDRALGPDLDHAVGLLPRLGVVLRRRHDDAPSRAPDADDLAVAQPGEKGPHDRPHGAHVGVLQDVVGAVDHRLLCHVTSPCPTGLQRARGETRTDSSFVPGPQVAESAATRSGGHQLGGQPRLGHVHAGQQLLDEGPVVEDRHLRDEHAAVALEVHQLLGQQERAAVELGHEAAGLVGHAPHLALGAQAAQDRPHAALVRLHPLRLGHLQLDRLHDAGQADLPEGPGQRRLHDGADERGEVLVGQADGHADGRPVDVGDVLGHHRPGRLVAHGGREQRNEEAVRRGVEPAHDPPVDDADAAVAQQHHVAGVHVAVEGAPAHRGEEEGAHHLLDQRGGVEAEVGHPGQVVDGDAVEELHRQHVAARELEVGLGHRHQLQVELALQPAEVQRASAPRCAGPSPRRSAPGSRRAAAGWSRPSGRRSGAPGSRAAAA